MSAEFRALLQALERDMIFHEQKRSRGFGQMHIQDDGLFGKGTLVDIEEGRNGVRAAIEKFGETPKRARGQLRAAEGARGPCPEGKKARKHVLNRASGDFDRRGTEFC